MKCIICPTYQDTKSLGARLASLLLTLTPAFVALYGALGAGKTAFVAGMGAYLGAQDVCSPTFTIIHEHDTIPRLIHIDAYRLNDADALYDVGFDDYIRERAIVVMEWPQNVLDALPKERLELFISGSGEEARFIEISGVGERYEKLAERL